MKKLNTLLIILSFGFLSACGGGGSSDDSSDYEKDFISINGLCYRISDSAQMDSSHCNESIEYYLSETQCYSKSNNELSDSSLCTSNSGYYLSNNLCYRNSGNVQVDYTNCSNITNSSDYYLSNNYCYRRSDNAPVATSYCTGTSSGACSGLHYWYDQSTGSRQQISCDGVATYGNCSGYYLYSSSTNAQVNCL